MKKFFFALGVFATSAFVFSACQKEQSVPDEPSDKLVTITFTAEKAGVETRTAAVVGETSVSYVWTDEDAANIKLFTVTTEMQGEGEQQHEVEVLTEVTNATVTKVSDTKMTISADVTPGATYKFRAILCDPDSYTGSGNNYGTRKPKVKAKQYPNGYSNFDPTADILVSDDEDVTVIESGEATINTGNLEMVFRRQVVVNKMTLKGLTAGEKVSKVVVTSTTGEIQGYLNNGAMAGQTKAITLEYNDVEVPSGGEFPVYFISMNNTGIALTIDVTTDQNSYTKSFALGKSINLNLGQFTNFGVALPAGIPITAVPSGDYFITAVYDGQVYAATMYVSGNNLSNPLAIDVDVENEEIDYVTDIEDCIFTLTRLTDGTYTIQDVNGLYLYAAGGNGNNPSNHLKGETEPDDDDNAYWSVSKNANGTYDIESVGNASRNIMRFNYNNGTPIFSCYGSGSNNPITLYPASWCTIDQTPHITIDDSEKTKTVLSAATSVVFNYTANRYAPAPTVQITSDPNSIISGEIDVADGQISVPLNPNTDNVSKTASLSVSGTGLASAVTLTINQEAYVNLVSGYESFDLTKKTYTTETNSVTWNGNSVTINNSGNNATNYLGGDANNRTSSRFYSGNTLTISPKSGYIITSVEFTATSDGYATVLRNSTWSNASAAGTATTVTVTPIDGTSAITATVGGTCGFTRIIVNYLTEGSGSGGDDEPDAPETITFSSLGLTNDTQYSDPFNGGHFTITFAGGDNDGKYYTTGSGIRTYGGGTITVESDYNISEIEFTWSTSYKPTSDVASPAGYSTDTSKWTGSAKSIVLTRPSGSGHWRLQAVKVTYE